MRLLITSILLLACLGVMGQEKKPKKITYKAKRLSSSEHLPKGVVLLQTDVVFEHEGIVMYCDSAYQNNTTNSLEAFNNVHMIQGDTLHAYGDYLKYDGNTKIAYLRENVRLVDDSTTLYTDFLDYYRLTSIGKYFNKGKIVSGENILTSEKGYYYSETKDVYFREDVFVDNPDYDIFSDTLRYNTHSETVYFLGPTQIVSENELLFGEDGKFNTKTDKGYVKVNTYATNHEQILYCDSLFINKAESFTEAFYNVEVIDTTNKAIMTGHYGKYTELKESIVMSDSALLMNYDKQDTLYLHADTIKTYVFPEDSLRRFFAYNHVKAFKKDLQMKCDSLVYSEKDSITILVGNPVLWSEENQITGDEVRIFQKDGQLSHSIVEQNAFIISEIDTTRYNQIKGRRMKGYFVNNSLQQIDFFGNGNAVYYAVDEDGIIGVNIAKSSDISIYLDEEGQLKRTTLKGTVEGAMHPEHLVQEQEKRLKGFKWDQKNRPMKKEDVFIWIE